MPKPSLPNTDREGSSPDSGCSSGFETCWWPQMPTGAPKPRVGFPRRCLWGGQVSLPSLSRLSHSEGRMSCPWSNLHFCCGLDYFLMEDQIPEKICPAVTLLCSPRHPRSVLLLLSVPPSATPCPVSASHGCKGQVPSSLPMGGQPAREWGAPQCPGPPFWGLKSEEAPLGVGRESGSASVGSSEARAPRHSGL